jgi:hypothetical protein
MTYAGWKGRNYVRQRVIPTNPRSASQTGVRSMFRFLAQAWSGLLAAEQGDYDAQAEALQLSAFNCFMKQNMDRWQLNQGPSKNSPAEETSDALTITTMSLTGGDGNVTVELTPSGGTSIWGYAIFRSPSEITTPNFTTCIAVIAADGANAVEYVDSPLAAGTYHYRAAALNDDGVIGTVKEDATAVVT